MLNIMSNNSYHGTTCISSLACLEHCCSIHNDADSVVFDVLIPMSQTMNHSNEVLCALLYAPDYDATPLELSIYCIDTQV
jgi:hypothetical protein